MRSVVLALAAAAALATSGPAAAQPVSDRSPLRCLLVLQAIARDPKQQENAVKGIFFYLGKLQARGGLTRVEPMMLSEAKTLTPQVGQNELKRCGAELNKQSTDLQAMNGRLQQAAKAAAPAKK
jgi:hypothetical protein